MLGRFLRIMLAITSIAPLSVSLCYVFASKGNNIQYSIIAGFVCLLLGAIALWVIDFSSNNLERLPITIKKAKSSDKEVIGFFLAYALPLIFKGSSEPDFGSWIMVFVMLLFVLWSTHAMHANPILGIFGFHYYEVETVDGITFLLITKKKINTVKSVNQVVQIGEYAIYEAATRGVNK